MRTNAERRKQDQLVLGMFLVIVSLSIITITLVKLSVLYLPVFIIELIGLFFIFYGSSKTLGEPLEYTFGPSQSRFRFVWGIILSTIGLLGIFYLGTPGADLILIIAILLLVVGILFLFFWRKGGK